MDISIQPVSRAWAPSPGMDDLAGPPDAADAGRFTRLMDKPAAARNDDAAGTEAPAIPGAASAAGPSGEPRRTVGDAILDGMKRMSRDVQDNVEFVQSSLHAASPSAVDLLRIQMHLAVAGVQMQLMGKVASKGPQVIDQCTKLQ